MEKLDKFMAMQQAQMAEFMTTLAGDTPTVESKPKNNAAIHPQGKRYDVKTIDDIREISFAWLTDNVGVRSKNKFNLYDLYRTFEVGSPENFSAQGKFNTLLAITDEKHVLANIAKQIVTTTPDASPKERLVMAIVALDAQKATLKASPKKAIVRKPKTRKERKQLTGRAVYLGTFTVNGNAPVQASITDGKRQHVETVHAGNLQNLVPHLEVGEYLGLNGLKTSTLNKCFANIPTAEFSDKMLQAPDSNGVTMYHKVITVGKAEYFWCNNRSHKNDDGSYISAKFVARTK